MPSQAALGTTTNDLDSPEVTDDEERDTSLDRGGSPVRNSLFGSPSMVSQVFSRLG
jgi:hypothetical protein